MIRVDKELRGSGELVTDEGLAGPDQAKIVRAQSGGTPAVTDGPFPEAKEFLAGHRRHPFQGIDRPVPAPGRDRGRS
jgi:hypothetical protein